MSVEEARKKGVRAERGTADQLPFEAESFDIVIFGFCLYLCDREDLFQIVQETDRALKKEAWPVVGGFFSATPTKLAYHHKKGIYSFKMDCRKIFEWHPAYTCYSHKLNHHEKTEFTDVSQEWVAMSVLRKKC